ncbi:hypothetical protein [Nocardioides sp. InS609-2]|uniref:hypothetical protein n=1 Tax=Nocardioides sp. InS609-2 TaxID=2760705 RepID=UPI0020C065CE|nr:hypothetical protein [Nocardioides sp. InS609-2]
MTSVRPTPAEVAAALPGDDRLDADVVMDRAFSLAAPPDVVWPWVLQLGRQRAGWYFPRSVERFFPHRRRGTRWIDPALQQLAVGDVVPDWGGRDETLTVLAVAAPYSLLYGTQRDNIEMTWSLVLTPADRDTRVHSRVRLAGVRRRWLAEYGGGFFDWLTIAGLAGGLRERVTRAP